MYDARVCQRYRSRVREKVLRRIPLWKWSSSDLDWIWFLRYGRAVVVGRGVGNPVLVVPSLQMHLRVTKCAWIARYDLVTFNHGFIFDYLSGVVPVRKLRRAFGCEVWGIGAEAIWPPGIPGFTICGGCERCEGIHMIL